MAFPYPNNKASVRDEHDHHQCPGWALCLAVPTASSRMACRRHNYWHIYDVSCDGCKFMDCSLPQPSRKSRLYWRAPKSNIHRPEPNNFYSVLLNCRFTSHKSPVLSVYIPHTITTKGGKHYSSSFFCQKNIFYFSKHYFRIDVFPPCG